MLRGACAALWFVSIANAGFCDYCGCHARGDYFCYFGNNCGNTKPNVCNSDCLMYQAPGWDCAVDSTPTTTGSRGGAASGSTRLPAYPNMGSASTAGARGMAPFPRPAGSGSASARFCDHCGCHCNGLYFCQFRNNCGLNVGSQCNSHCTEYEPATRSCAVATQEEGSYLMRMLILAGLACGACGLVAAAVFWFWRARAVTQPAFQKASVVVPEVDISPVQLHLKQSIHPERTPHKGKWAKGYYY